MFKAVVAIAFGVVMGLFLYGLGAPEPIPVVVSMVATTTIASAML